MLENLLVLVPARACAQRGAGKISKVKTTKDFLNKIITNNSEAGRVTRPRVSAKSSILRGCNPIEGASAQADS